MNRRTLIQISAAAAGAGCGRRRNGNSSRLTAGELSLLELIAEQIIPSGEDPGAREAGAAHYINEQLTGRLEEFPERYHKGLAATEACCVETHGRSFSALKFGERTRFLRLLEKGKVNLAHWKHQPPGAFFAMVRMHVIEGTFCPPRYGGNRDLAGYRLIGWEYPEPGGQNRYTDPRFTHRGKKS